MKTTIRTSSRELGALLLYTLDWHQQERHNADIEVCDDPICALANAIAGIDPVTGTFEPGNHAITITVEAGDMAKQDQESDEMRRQVGLCGVAMYYNLDSDELEEILNAAGVSYHEATPEQAAEIVRQTGKPGGPFARWFGH